MHLNIFFYVKIRTDKGLSISFFVVRFAKRQRSHRRKEMFEAFI
jgi:hypothetical protein